MAETDTGVDTGMDNGAVDGTENGSGNEVGAGTVSNINNASTEELFESLFANTGSRETISLRDWMDGWSAIVGGINGIPTSRQFNTLQYITDMKFLKLYRDVVALQLAGAVGIKFGTKEELNQKNMILFEILKNTNRIFKIHRRDSEDNAYEYDLASVFKVAEERGRLQSGDTLGELFGQIARYLADLKVNCFTDADDPFNLMTEATYKPPSRRTKGCAYGFVTAQRGLIIIFFDRYITGMEDPTVKETLYGVEKTQRTGLEMDNRPYKAIFSNVVYLEEGEETTRQTGKIYAVVKETR